MKKFKSLFLVAAALMIGFSSCGNDEGGEWKPYEGPGTSPGASMTFSLVAPGARAIGESQVDHQVALTSGTILFSNGVTIMRAVPADINDLLDVTVGQRVDDLPGGVTHVHFVGNTNLVGMPGIATLDALANAPLTLVTQNLLTVQSQRNVANINQMEDNVVNVWGSTSYLYQEFAGTALENPRYEAHIMLEPTVARVELFNVTGDALIHSFRVSGIFMDNYYETRGVGGVGGVFRVRGTGMGGSYEAFQAGPLGGFVANPALAGVVYDVGNWPAVALTAATTDNPANVGLMRARPAGAMNQVWGYNLFAGLFGAPNPSAANAAAGQMTIQGTRTPRIAVRLEEVRVREATTVTFTWVNAAAVPFEIEVDLGLLELPHELARHQDPLWVNPPNSAWFITLAEANGMVFDNVSLVATPPAVTPGFVTALRNHYTARWIAGRQGAPAGFDHSLFISIRGFTGINVNTGFQPRRVYMLGSYMAWPGGSEWTFGPGDLDYIPFRRDIDVTVTVEIQEWEHVHVTPQL